MIKEINISNNYRSIKPPFSLEISDFTVITGENNVGKTNFFEAVNGDFVKFIDDKGNETKNVEIITIPSQMIIGDEAFKLNKTSESVSKTRDFLEKSLPKSKLSFNLGVKKNITSRLDSEVNKIISSIISPQNNSLKVSINNNLNLLEVLHQVLEFEVKDPDSGKSRKKFEELGQGLQRLIIASFLLGASKSNRKDKSLKLVLFEEPEAYLHPEWKKTLNRMLKELSNEPNYQVIITTHDPYFAMTNMKENGNNMTYSFFKKKGITDKKSGIIFGVEDELLHIHLFTRLLDSVPKTNKNMGCKPKKNGLNKYIINEIKNMGIKKGFSKRYIWPNNQVEIMALPLYIRHILHHPDNNNTKKGKNKYLHSELRRSIEIMNKLLS